MICIRCGASFSKRHFSDTTCPPCREYWPSKKFEQIGIESGKALAEPIVNELDKLRAENERLQKQLDYARQPRIYGDALITYIIQNRLIHAVDKEVIVWAANAPEMLETIVNGIKFKEPDDEGI